MDATRVLVAGIEVDAAMGNQGGRTSAVMAGRSYLYHRQRPHGPGLTPSGNLIFGVSRRRGQEDTLRTAYELGVPTYTASHAMRSGCNLGVGLLDRTAAVTYPRGMRERVIRTISVKPILPSRIRSRIRPGRNGNGRAAGSKTRAHGAIVEMETDGWA